MNIGKLHQQIYFISNIVRAGSIHFELSLLQPSESYDFPWISTEKLHVKISFRVDHHVGESPDWFDTLHADLLECDFLDD